MPTKRANRKVGQTDFYKVKVTFVGEEANKTSECTSLLGDFTVVVTFPRSSGN